MNKKPKIIIIAGPNGAGKTTFAEEYLPKEGNCPVFVNANIIASRFGSEASRQRDIAAAKTMLGELNSHFSNRLDFAFETTLSGRNYIKHIKKWRKAGYSVSILFLKLNDPAEAIARVMSRVKQGGHDRHRTRRIKQRPRVTQLGIQISKVG